MDTGFRSNLYERFPLYRAYRFVREYKSRIAFFSRIRMFLFSYETSTYVPNVDFTLPHVVERISSAAYPQLAFRSSLSHHIEGRCLFFTDASKTNSHPHTGAAYYSPDIPMQRKYKLDGYFSIFSAECIAIICAVDCILERAIKKTSIFTDSRSVVETMSRCTLDGDPPHLILILKNKLRSASLQGLDIILIWIPSHVGILGNETADFLAGEATRHGEAVDFLPPHTDFYSVVRERYFEAVEKHLLALAKNHGKQYFTLYPAFARNPWLARLKLSRSEIATISRIRSNHYNLNYSLHRCGIVGRPECPCGSPLQDIEHILWSCPLLNDPRKQLLDSLRKALGCPPPYNVFELLTVPSAEIVHSIVSFLHKSDLQV